MDIYKRQYLKRTSSGLGFMVFAITGTMNLVALILSIALLTRLDTTLSLWMQMFISVSCMFISGMVYCWASKSDINKLIKVKRVSPKLAVPLIIIALTVSFTSDYLADLLQSSFSVFGLENGIELNTESTTPVNFLLNIIAVSVVPPLVEEFVFRGVLLGKLRRFGDGFAVLMSSVIFGLIHENLVQIPFAFIVGLALAFTTVKCGSVVPAIIVHFIVNFRATLISSLIDNKVISEEILNIIYIVFLIVVFILGIVSAYRLSKKEGFFSLESNPDYPFGESLGAFIGNGGMICFLVIVVINTISTTSLFSFLGG